MYQQPNYSYFAQYHPQMMRQDAAYPVLKGRQVTSLDEAKAASIDFDGSVFYFPDLANGRIYTKQINLDGTASLYMYELKEIPVSPQNTSGSDTYITREEFEKAIEQLKVDLQKKEVTKIEF